MELLEQVAAVQQPYLGQTFKTALYAMNAAIVQMSTIHKCSHQLFCVDRQRVLT